MAIAWSALILLCLTMYVLLDGYDLGIGVATLFERDERQRNRMLEQVAFTWDGNETWLVLLGVGLWAGFPLVFGTILPHAYLALVVVLFSLIVRGVSVEMASQMGPSRAWERAFGIASLTATLGQGLALATLTSTLTVSHGAFSGSAFGAIGWFSGLAAAAVTCTYVALGYTYLNGKSSGAVRTRVAHRGALMTVIAGLLIAGCLVALAGTAAPLNLQSPGRATGFAGLLLFAAAGLVVTVTTLRPTARSTVLPFAGLATAVVAALGAVVVARAPVIVPPSLTVANSMSPANTMAFIGVGIGLNVPLVLFYNWFAHHTFQERMDSVLAES